jgi:hypothetical protein
VPVANYYNLLQTHPNSPTAAAADIIQFYVLLEAAGQLRLGEHKVNSDASSDLTPIPNAPMMRRKAYTVPRGLTHRSE